MVRGRASLTLGLARVTSIPCYKDKPQEKAYLWLPTTEHWDPGQVAGSRREKEGPPLADWHKLGGTSGCEAFFQRPITVSLEGPVLEVST